MRDLDALTAALHERGLRVTPQRQMIYALPAGSPSHPESTKKKLDAIQPA